MSLKKVLQNRSRNSNHFVWNNIEVFIKDPITNPDFTFQIVLAGVEKLIPKEMLRNLDSIYVGDFEFLKSRDIQASYENSSIFITNEQDSIEDMSDDLVHEIAHSVEEIKADLLYSDGALEQEFISKRKRLFSILENEGYSVDLLTFLDPDFSFEFDNFLHQEVGYTALSILTANLFYSPYAATSLQEYYANGFEAYYYYRDTGHLQRISPILFNKIYSLVEEN